MHAELRPADEFDPTSDATSAPEDVASPPSAHSLMAVLMPANPPQPKNARIIRLFDLEAAKYDPRPADASAPQAAAPAAAAAPAPKKENSRSALREERSKSLFAAARYF